MAEVFKSESGRQKILAGYREILETWPVPNRQYLVETPQGETFVIESGERGNPAILLLHGSVSNSFAWYGDVLPLSQKYNVFAVDIIGEAGFSAPERPAYTSGAYANWLKELVTRLELPSCALAGLSLGGWMALNYATTFPELVDKLILLCPGGLAREKASFIPKALFYSLFGKWGQKQVFKIVNGGKLPDEAGMEKAMAFTSLINKNFNPRLGKLPIHTKQELSRLSMPVLLIFGENDYLLDVDQSVDHLKNAVPHAEMVILPDTGHAVVNQADRILNFLKA